MPKPPFPPPKPPPPRSVTSAGSSIRTGIPSRKARIVELEIDLRKNKFLSGACFFGGLVGIICHQIGFADHPIGYGFLAIGVVFRFVPRLYIERNLNRLRNEAIISNVIET